MSASPRTSPFLFFILVFLISVPLWLMGDRTGWLPVPINLPLSALMTFVPMFVALGLTYWETGPDGAKALLMRAVDARRVLGIVWYLPALLLMPASMLVVYIVMRVAGAALPEPHIPLDVVPVLFLMFFIGAIGEELGWQGYAFPRLQAKWNALEASLVLGIIWAFWHVIPLVQTHHGAEWVFWQSLMMPALRLITVWLFVDAGQSVFITVLFHASGNVAQFLFPNYGSHYEPFTSFVILTLVAGTLILLWGPSLVRFRYA